MNRILCILMVVTLLQACASPIEPRPRALLDAEQNMQRGIAAYRNDEYNLAANSFTNALDLYQSIDDGVGVFEASLNLAQTGITIDNLGAARKHLQRLKTPGARALSADETTRLSLLEIRLLHAEGELEQALNLLQPLWPTFDKDNRVLKGGGFSTAVIAATARITQKLEHPEASLWLERLERNVSAGDDEIGLRNRALLLRLKAYAAKQARQVEVSQRLLEQALDIYRGLVHRRGMAVTLQHLAELHLERNDALMADSLYQRSLKIHLWTLNKKAAIQVLEALIKINRELGDAKEVEVFSEQLKRLEN